MTSDTKGAASLLEEDDPYVCTLTVRASANEAQVLRNLFSPLLKGVDPGYNYISVQETSERPHQRHCIGTTSEHQLNCQPRAPSFAVSGTCEDSEPLTTPAMSVILFLKECGSISSETALARLKQKPWSFHHQIALNNVRLGQPTSQVARQEFYEPLPGFPLWSVSSKHAGNEILRYNISVNDFAAMAKFYRTILNKPLVSRAGYSLFTLYSQPCMDVQLALKYSPSLDAVPLQSSYMTFKVNNMNRFEPAVLAEMVKIGPAKFALSDPDGNLVILEDIGTMRLWTEPPSWVDEEMSKVGKHRVVCSTDSIDSGRWSVMSGDHLGDHPGDYFSDQSLTDIESTVASTTSRDSSSSLSFSEEKTCVRAPESSPLAHRRNAQSSSADLVRDNNYAVPQRRRRRSSATRTDKDDCVFYTSVSRERRRNDSSSSATSTEKDHCVVYTSVSGGRRRNDSSSQSADELDEGHIESTDSPQFNESSSWESEDDDCDNGSDSEWDLSEDEAEATRLTYLELTRQFYRASIDLLSKLQLFETYAEQEMDDVSGNDGNQPSTKLKIATHEGQSQSPSDDDDDKEQGSLTVPRETSSTSSLLDTIASYCRPEDLDDDDNDPEEVEIDEIIYQNYTVFNHLRTTLAEHQVVFV